MKLEKSEMEKGQKPIKDANKLPEKTCGKPYIGKIGNSVSIGQFVAGKNLFRWKFSRKRK